MTVPLRYLPLEQRLLDRLQRVVSRSSGLGRGGHDSVGARIFGLGQKQSAGIKLWIVDNERFFNAYAMPYLWGRGN